MPGSSAPSDGLGGRQGSRWDRRRWRTRSWGCGLGIGARHRGGRMASCSLIAGGRAGPKLRREGSILLTPAQGGDRASSPGTGPSPGPAPPHSEMKAPKQPESPSLAPTCGPGASWGSSSSSLRPARSGSPGASGGPAPAPASRLGGGGGSGAWGFCSPVARVRSRRPAPPLGLLRLRVMLPRRRSLAPLAPPPPPPPPPLPSQDNSQYGGARLPSARCQQVRGHTESAPPHYSRRLPAPF